MGEVVLRVYQEDWFPFQNLPASLREFTAETGIGTELVWDKVGIGTIEGMFNAMDSAFVTGDINLVCCDEIILKKMVLHDMAAPLRDSTFDWNGVTPAVRDCCVIEGAVYALPCVNVCNLLMYRKDLLEKYNLPVPSTWAELESVCLKLQSAMRQDGQDQFFAFETRGASGAGHAGWMVGSFIQSFGATWLDRDGTPSPIGPQHVEAMETYLRLLTLYGSPDPGHVSFVEMRDHFASGQVGMVLEVGMEYAHALQTNPALAGIADVAIIPAGPAGSFPDLYCPVWSVPKRSPNQDAAWQLARFLTSDRVLMDDALKSNAIEVSSLRLLHSAEFAGHFHAGLLNAVKASRPLSREGRPFGTYGLAGAAVVGEQVNLALTKKQSARQALENINAALIELTRQMAPIETD